MPATSLHHHRSWVHKLDTSGGDATTGAASSRLRAVTDGLKHRWVFGSAIGKGGFARVVQAVDENGKAHAAKFVAKQPGASRELLLAELSGARNVIPVVDSGETDDEYVLIMPMAETSLREHIEKNGPLPVAEALKVLIDIATALADLDGKVIHRDLKPENVLSLDGTWCLADFGISRYADAITEADETRKHFLTAPYAAPEQWLSEHATRATDVYSFGIMAFELLEGARPFNGTREQLRDAHLHSDPPAMSVGPVLAALVQECLFKAQEARPAPANLLAKLNKAEARAADPRWSRLASANHAEVQRQAAADAQSAREQTEFERRRKLFDAATTSWSRISEQFHEIIREHLSAAALHVRSDKHWSVNLNEASFGLSYPQFQGSRVPEMPFDVVATATLSVLTSERTSRTRQWIGRSHSLFFSDAFIEGEYGWVETAFMDMPLVKSAGSRDLEPFAMVDLQEHALHHALGNVLGVRQVAWEFTPIDSGDCDDFLQRWLDWFASASEHRLWRPHQMPEHPIARNWRR